ncbi:LCP family glycopolymer transferase [Levilactobacillus yiduensis]|uniref:LCP family glycopolymer transferase n=1 Tax=Levilactobacillus yiduensis TaxID=2953880 RepID=UPI000EF2A293|nr:LCP family protein [Levilactobacillus yiduensis]AYM02797.1 LytR family transcriptional regulator [Levilactobacillus brevis]
MQNRNKKHTVRNSVMVAALFVLLGGSAYGMTRYRSIKNAINSSFVASAATRRRSEVKQVKKTKPVSLLLVGADSKTSADSQMLITMNPSTKKTTVTSIPHTTAVRVSGHAKKAPSRMKDAYKWGGINSSINTTQNALNVPVDFYAVLKPSALKKVVNKGGGVTVKSNATFSNFGYSFKKGVKTTLKGNKTLAYVAAYKGDPKGTNAGKQSRQQAVLAAVLKKSATFKTLFNQGFINSLAGAMKTDLTFNEMTKLVKNYRVATKSVSKTVLHGSMHRLNNKTMKVVKKSELQRVTNFTRKGLSLSHKTTGKAAVFTAKQVKAATTK